MNLKKTTLALAIAATAATPFTFADTKISGKLNVNLEKTDDGTTETNWMMYSDDIEIDITAVEAAGSVKYIADIDLDFSDTDGAQGNFDIEAARIIIAGGFGAFVLSDTTPSGQFADIYGGTYVMYEYSDFYTDQGTEAPALLAWKTPNFGPVYAVVAVFPLGGDENSGTTGVVTEEESDVFAARVKYQANGVYVGAGLVDYEGESLSDRTAIGAGYEADMFSVAISYEMQDESEDGTSNPETNVVNLGATYSATDALTLKLAWGQEDVDGADEKNSAATFGVEYALAENVAVYFETTSGDAQGDNDADSDATVFGAQVSF